MTESKYDDAHIKQDRIYHPVAKRLDEHLTTVERVHGMDQAVVVCQRLIQDLTTRISMMTAESDDAWDQQTR